MSSSRPALRWISRARFCDRLIQSPGNTHFVKRISHPGDFPIGSPFLILVLRENPKCPAKKCRARIAFKPRSTTEPGQNMPVFVPKTSFSRVPNSSPWCLLSAERMWFLHVCKMIDRQHVPHCVAHTVERCAFPCVDLCLGLIYSTPRLIADRQNSCPLSPTTRIKRLRKP